MPIAREPLGDKREVVAYGYDHVVVRRLTHPELQHLIGGVPDDATVYATSRGSVTTNTRRGVVYVRPADRTPSYRGGGHAIGARSVAISGASGIISTGDNAVIRQSASYADVAPQPSTLYLYVPDNVTVDTADGDLDDQRIQ